MELVASPGATARHLAAQAVAVSHDGAHVAYTTSDTSALIVERSDGGDSTQVTGSANAAFELTPDDQYLGLCGPRGRRGALRGRDRREGDARAGRDGARARRRAGDLAGRARGAGQRHAERGRRLALFDGTETIYVHGNSQAFVAAAAYLDAGLVLTDLSSQLVITDGVAPKNLASTDGAGCTAQRISRDLRQIMIACSVPSIIDFTGELVSSRANATGIGMSSDGAGLISLRFDGVLEITTQASGTRTLAQAMAANLGQLTPPFASYPP